MADVSSLVLALASTLVLVKQTLNLKLQTLNIKRSYPSLFALGSHSCIRGLPPGSCPSVPSERPDAVLKADAVEILSEQVASLKLLVFDAQVEQRLPAIRPVFESAGTYHQGNI